MISENLQELIGRSLRIYNGMLDVFPQYNRVEVLNCTWVSKFSNGFSIRNSNVSFVADGELYVTPYTRATLAILRAEGFTQQYFFVPFCEGDYPREHEKEWNTLCESAKQRLIDDFRSDCIEFSEVQGIGKLPKEVLDNCFKIPDTGIKVKHPRYNDTYYPILRNSFDNTVIEKIGKFGMRKNVVIFVYCDGNTYVAKGKNLAEILCSKGYSEAGIFVPFADGEKIEDPILAKKWAKCRRF